MLSKIKSYATKPSTYVLLALGGLLALAVPAVRNILAPVAAKIPGAK
jgi:hypothetical protein